MENKEYNTVGTVQKFIANLIPLTHKDMTAHFPGLVQALQ